MTPTKSSLDPTRCGGGHSTSSRSRTLALLCVRRRMKMKGPCPDVEAARAAASLFDPGRLVLARHAAGLRQTELASRIGVTPAAISQFEHGTSRPSSRTVAQLSLAL